VLADLVADPLRTPFIADLVLLVPATVGVLLTPETVERRGVRIRLQRLGVPPEVRAVFVRGSAAAFAAFAVSGVFSSVGPSFLGRVLGERSHTLAGLLVFVLFGSSLVGQLIVRQLSDRRALTLGCALELVGAGVLGVAIGIESLTALFASSVLAGLGQGVVIGAALAAINQRAPVERRGETASSFFVVIYVGLSVPVIGAGLAISAFSLKSAGIAFSIGVAALVAAVLVSQVREPD
jgi:MFS family permease